MHTYREAFEHFMQLSLFETQAEFCKASNLSSAYVSQLLKGKNGMPKFDRACIIADTLGVSLQDFRDYMESD